MATFTSSYVVDLGNVTGTLAVTNGGTGLSSLATGGILYISATNTLARLAPSAVNFLLRSTGANALQFAAGDAADIGAGTLAVARGGTGLGALTAGGVLQISATDTLARLSPSAAHQVLRATAANTLEFADNHTVATGSVVAARTTTSATRVHWGLAAALTPTTSGRVLAIFMCDYKRNQTANIATGHSARYGTGAAPALGDAETGTLLALGNGLREFVTVDADRLGFLIEIGFPTTPLTLDTAYWFDLTFSSAATGTAEIASACVALIEM